MIRRVALAPIAAALLATVVGCRDATTVPPDDAEMRAQGALVGAEPVEAVHLYENHSSALIAWRRARERDRVLVHVDGHADMDWLPESTVARIAAAHPDELTDLEQHPYAIDDSTLQRFGIWNFIYPATRLGIVREVVWVVPDGTFARPESMGLLVHEILLGRLQMIAGEEAQGFHRAGRTVQGTLFGIPITICELADLPDFAEPVLLDIDLNYLTTSSALTQEVTATPRMSPGSLLAALRAKGLRTDRVTLSLSTFGGSVPPSARWLGPSFQRWLGEPGASPAQEDRLRLHAEQAELRGDATRAAQAYRRLLERRADDASAWFGLSRSLRRLGKVRASQQAHRRAMSIDPVLVHGELMAGDRLWLNQQFAAALPYYRAYLREHGKGPFGPYARRRVASCLMHLGLTDEAVEAFRAVVASAPGHAESRVDLGVLLRERGEIDAAMDEFRTARQLQPDLATAAMALGTTYLLAGKVEQGVGELEQAVERKPCWALAHGNLAVGLASLGRHAEAKRHLEQALSLQPANPQIQIVAQQLRERGIRSARAP